MKKFAAFIFGLAVVSGPVLAQTATNTPVNTATNTPTPTVTNTPTNTFTPTNTPDPVFEERGEELTKSRVEKLTAYAPGAKAGNLEDVLKRGVRQIRKICPAQNGFFGVNDARSVVSIFGFTTADGTGVFAVPNSGYQVVGGDIKVTASIASNTTKMCVVTYRP